MSYAKSRYRNGKTDMCVPSRFLKDIDACYLDRRADRAAPSETFVGRERYQRPAFASPLLQPKDNDGLHTPAAPVKRTLTRLAPASDVSAPASSVVSVAGLDVGVRVRHDRFGEGEIVALEGEGGNRKATVLFDHFGQKQLLLKFAKLQVLPSS